MKVAKRGPLKLSDEDLRKLIDVKDQITLAKTAVQRAMGHLARAEQVFPEPTEK